jgi:hypothetical protein
MKCPVSGTKNNPKGAHTMTESAATPKERGAVLVLPSSLGLSEADVESLKESFQNTVVERMSGRAAAEARPVVIVVFVEQ